MNMQAPTEVITEIFKIFAKLETTFRVKKDIELQIEYLRDQEDISDLISEKNSFEQEIIDVKNWLETIEQLYVLPFNIAESIEQIKRSVYDDNIHYNFRRNI